MSGMLYLCATPIGNLEDITLRALRILKEVDLIACEDTRTSSHLLNHFEIHTPLISYHKFNEEDRGDELVDKMLQGKQIALISDAGTPAISDPGEILVRKCIEAGITVTSLPGCNAGITALTMSGQPTRAFVFEGFLPSDHKDRRMILERLKTETRTILLYEAPHRLVKTLLSLEEVLGGDRGISLCRELTKKHEEGVKTTIREAITHAQEQPPRGEYVLVIQGRNPEDIAKEQAEQWSDLSVREHVAYYEAKGMDRKAAMKACAKDRGMSKRDIYRILIN